MNIKTAVILAGGSGKRLDVYNTQKPLVTVGSKLLISWVIRALREAGLTELYILTNKNNQALHQYLVNKGFDDKIIVIEQDEKIKSELGAMLSIKSIATKPFLVTPCDLIFEKNPFKYMKNADILVISSRWEGFPCVLEEAMCVGTPIISTDCNFGPNEIIKNNQNGILVKPEYPEELYLAIKRLINDKKLQNKFRIKSRAYSKQFDIYEVVKKYIDLIE